MDASTSSIRADRIVVSDFSFRGSFLTLCSTLVATRRSPSSRSNTRVSGALPRKYFEPRREFVCSFSRRATSVAIPVYKLPSLQRTRYRLYATSATGNTFYPCWVCIQNTRRTNRIPFKMPAAGGVTSHADRRGTVTAKRTFEHADHRTRRFGRQNSTTASAVGA